MMQKQESKESPPVKAEASTAMKTETSMAIKDETSVSVKVEASVKLEASSLLSNGVTACPTRDHARTPAVESGMLAQRVLGECGPALYRHLDASSRRVLRLVCKAARAGVDTSVTALLLRKQDVSSGPTQRALAACGRRWPAAQALEFDACRGLSFRGCVLPPGLRAVRLAGTNRLMPSGLAPLAARSATLQQLSYRQHSSGPPCSATASSEGLCKELGALLPRLASLTDLCIDSNVLPPHKTSSADDDTTDFLASLRTMPLQHLKLLRFADLAGSKVMPAVTRALCESLSHLTRLQTLHITLPLGLRGAKALAPVLQRLVRLRNLGLADCNLNAEERGGAGAGGKRVKAQRQQAPAGAGPDEGGTRFAIGFLTDALAALPHIEQLHLQCNSLGHALLLLPPRLPHLHTLNIAANCPDEKKRPGASDPAPVAPMLAQLLPRYPTLTELDIGRNALEVEDAAQLSAALLGTAALRVLRMAACGPNQRAVLGPTLVAVCRLPCLETLDLRHNPLEALGEGQAMAAFWRALPQLRTLRRLDLHHTRLDAPAVAALCKALRVLTRLEALDISENKLGQTAAVQLSGALPSLLALRELRADYQSWGAGGTATICRALHGLPGLELVQLDR